MQPTEERATAVVDDGKRVEAVEKELEFYRKRQLAVYYFAVLAQVLVVTGDRYVRGIPSKVATVIYVIFFVGVFAFAVLLASSYAERIWYLRRQRLRLLSRPTDAEPLLPEHGAFRSISPSWLYGAMIGLLSVVGVMLTIGGRTIGD